MLEGLGKHNKIKWTYTLQSSESLFSWKMSPPVMSIIQYVQDGSANSDACTWYLNIIIL